MPTHYFVGPSNMTASIDVGLDDDGIELDFIVPTDPTGMAMPEVDLAAYNAAVVARESAAEAAVVASVASYQAMVMASPDFLALKLIVGEDLAKKLLGVG